MKAPLMMMQFNHTSSGQILLLLWHVRKGQKLNWSFLELISPLISSSPSNISHLHAMWMFIMFIRWAVFSVHLYHILELRPLHVYWLRGYLRSWGKRKHYSWSGVVILPAPTQTLHNIKRHAQIRLLCCKRAENPCGFLYEAQPSCFFFKSE